MVPIFLPVLQFCDKNSHNCLAHLGFDDYNNDDDDNNYNTCNNKLLKLPQCNI